MAAEVEESSGARRAALEQRPRVGVIFVGLLLAMLLAALDQTIVATALPRIVSDLGGAEHLSWVVTAYLLAVTASTPLWGKLGDLFGRKRVFLATIVIFLVGSALCGVASNMGMLIAFRALQGLGGGGLIVVAQAVIADVVPPRDRGRYQGLFGAVFGLASVAGPLLGGFFVDNLSWRWVFYINLPIGVIALAVIVATLHLPSTSDRRPRIDYAGTTLIAAAATALVLLTTLGGTSWPWGGFQTYVLAVLAAVLLVGFVLVERRAAEPVLPLRLFGSSVFVVCAAVGFIVGFAMFGSLSFLPLFMQVVNGDSPTQSGLRLIPMMVGVLLTSITSGRLISRWGRYRPFPIAGMLLMAVGMFLLSRMNETTTTLESSIYLLVLGLGIGSVIQVLVIAVQNDAPYEDLGAATSGATFFRTIGGSFGAAVFGAVFTAQLTSGLSGAAASGRFPPNFPVRAAENSPELLGSLPPAARDAFVHAYATALDRVFLVATFVALAGLVFALFLKQVPLRRTTRSADVGESYAIPKESTSDAEVTAALSRALSREAIGRRYRLMIERAGVDMTPVEAWVFLRVSRGERVTAAELLRRARYLQRPEIDAAVDRLRGRGLLVGGGTELRTTPAGDATADRLTAARRRMLEQYLDDWSIEQRADLALALRALAEDTLGADSDPRRLLARREGLPERAG